VEVPNRAELEARLAKRLARVQRALLLRLLDELGDPPQMANISPSFWDDAGTELTRVIRPELQNFFEEQALVALTVTPLGVDWALVNQRAVTWARNYTYELVRGINNTTRNALQNAIGDFFQEAMTREVLEGRISPLFGPVRAEMIAVTEVTRASVEGERALANLLAQQGIMMRPYWLTSNDEISQRCPICGPKHNVLITDDVFPPGHIRCRCTVRYDLPEGF